MTNAPPRVLWVEDSPDDVLLMRLAAEPTAFAGQYEVATNGDQAISRAMEATAAGVPHSVVVCDLRLGNESGWDVITRLREDGAERTYIVLSSSSDDKDVQRTAALGCQHITKPITLEGWRQVAEELAGAVQTER